MGMERLMKDLHCVDDHASEPEWNGLRKLLSPHCDLEAVTEVYVQNLASMLAEHQIGGVPVA